MSELKTLNIELLRGVPCEGCKEKCLECFAEIQPNIHLIKQLFKGAEGVRIMGYDEGFAKGKLALLVETKKITVVTSVLKAKGFVARLAG